MKEKRGLLILVSILALIFIINNDVHTGKASARPPSGTCHVGCCVDGSDMENMKRYDCIEKATKENSRLWCTADSNSLNSDCLSMRFTSDKSIVGAGGMAGCYTRKSLKEAKSSPRPGINTDHCFGGSAIRPAPSRSGGCDAIPENCWRQNKVCNINGGEAKCV